MRRGFRFCRCLLPVVMCALVFSPRTSVAQHDTGFAAPVPAPAPTPTLAPVIPVAPLDPHLASGTAPDAQVSESDVPQRSSQAKSAESLTALPSFSLMPSKPGYIFSPPSRTVTLPPDASAQDFVGAFAPTVGQYPGGLVHWWPAEGNADDIIGGNNGTLLNGVTYTAGKVGQAFNFDGTSGIVDLGTNNLIGSGDTAFTVAFWMEATRMPDGGQYFFPIRLKQDSQFFVAIPHDYRGIPGDYIVGAFRGQPRQWWVPFDASTVYHRWVHVAVVYTGGGKSSAASYRYFFDGAQLAGTAVDLGWVGGQCNDNALGSDVFNGCANNYMYFQGAMDEVQIYNRALSASEIHSIYVTEPLVQMRNTKVNLRSGPGTNYPVVGSASPGAQLRITGKNPAGNWWQVCCVSGQEAWVAAWVVDASGPIERIPVITNVPPPVPTGSNGQQIAFAVESGKFTYLQIEGTNQNGQWATWQTSSRTGMSLALTKDYWWKGTVVLVFDIVNVGRRRCVIDYLREAKGSTMAAVVYAEGSGCSGEGGSAARAGSTQVLIEYMNPQDADRIVDAADFAYNARGCLLGIANGFSGSMWGKAMMIKDCAGAGLSVINEVLKKYNLYVTVK